MSIDGWRRRNPRTMSLLKSSSHAGAIIVPLAFFWPSAAREGLAKAISLHFPARPFGQFRGDWPSMHPLVAGGEGRNPRRCTRPPGARQGTAQRFAPAPPITVRRNYCVEGHASPSHSDGTLFIQAQRKRIIDQQIVHKQLHLYSSISLGRSGPYIGRDFCVKYRRSGMLHVI
jgi:hypothetical protein